MSTETDVLIVGGGPTGLMAALCLADAGIRCRIIDKAPVRSDKSRALVVHARTLELFQRLGFAGDLVPLGRSVVQARWYVGDHAPLNIDLGDLGIDDTPYPFMLFVSQVETERAMEAALRARGVEVERPVELVSFTQDAAGVAALLTSNGAEQVVRAQYLVGADGAHSVVRKTAGFRFEGAPYAHNFVLADTEVEWDGDDAALRVFLRPHGMMLAFPMAGAHRYRIICAETGKEAPPGEDASLEEVQAMVDQLSSVPAKLREPHWLARFHLHHRGVDHYRAGRAFVAGDAAHIHSPAGGQGMNTGIQDAANLGWKLAAVLKDHAGAKLLDSYEAERLPVGRQLLQFTDRLFSLAATTSSMVVGIRDFILPHLVPFVTAHKERRALAFRHLAELAVHYRGSPVVGTDSGFSGGLRPGERAADGAVRLANGKTSSLFKQTAGLRHDLVVFQRHASPAPLPEIAQPWVNVIAVEPSPELERHYGIERPSMYLIRPDGYVAMRSATVGPEPIERFLRQAYGVI